MQDAQLKVPEIKGSEKPGKILSLQALRAYAFLDIFLLHCGLGSLGVLGVSIFLVLSGFVLQYTYQNKEINCTFTGNAQFAIKKIGKLYPLHILLLAGMIIIELIPCIKNQSFASLFPMAPKALVNALLLQSWIPRSSYYFSFNGVAWYLSVSLFLYFCFPYIHQRIMRYKGSSDAIRSIAFTFFIQLLISTIVYFGPFSKYTNRISDGFPKYITYIFPVYRLGDFFIGCNLGYLYTHDRSHTKKQRTVYSILEGIAVIIIGGGSLIYKEQISVLGSEPFRYTLLVLPIAMMIVYLFAVHRGFITKLAVNRIAIWIGNLSAYTFLFHQLVIRYFKLFVSRFFDCQLNTWLTAGITFVITMCAALIWRKIVHRKR